MIVEDSSDESIPEISAAAAVEGSNSGSGNRAESEPSSPPWEEQWPDDPAPERSDPLESPSTLRDITQDPTPTYDVPLGRALVEASPLLIVAAACFGLGFFLHQTGNSGPVPVFPVWTLFFALGFVAALGAGGSLVLSGETERPDSYVRAKSSKTRRADPVRMSQPVSPGRRHPTPKASVVEATRAAGLLAIPPGARGEPEDAQPIVSEWADPMEAAPPVLADAPESSSSKEVLEQIDRLLADLKPVRARSRPS